MVRNPNHPPFERLLTVVYFDQRTGAAHRVCWSKYTFLHFLPYFIKLLIVLLRNQRKNQRKKTSKNASSNSWFTP